MRGMKAIREKNMYVYLGFERIILFSVAYYQVMLLFYNINLAREDVNCLLA